MAQVKYFKAQPDGTAKQNKANTAKKVVKAAPKRKQVEAEEASASAPRKRAAKATGESAIVIYILMEMKRIIDCYF